MEKMKKKEGVPAKKGEVGLGLGLDRDYIGD